MKPISLTLLLLLAYDTHAQSRLAKVWQHRAWSSGIAQAKNMLWHGVAALVLSCSPLACSVHLQDTPPALVQEDAAAFFVNKNVHFRIDGRSYRGRVTERLAGEDKVVIIPRYDSEKIVAVEDISGVLIDQHELLFAHVRAPVKEDRLRYVEGMVVAIFTDGYAAVNITVEVDRQHHRRVLKPPYDVFYPIRQLTLLEKNSRKQPEVIAVR